MKRKIELIKFLSIRYADPITSLELSDKYLCFGSMLGLLKYFIIDSNLLIQLSEKQDEFISGILLIKMIYIFV